MIRRPPRSTRTYTLFPYPTLFLSPRAPLRAAFDAWLRLLAGLSRAPPQRAQDQALPCVADRRTRARPAQPRLIVMPAEAGISFNRKTPAFAGVTNRLSPPHGHRSDRPSPRKSEERRVGNKCVRTCKSRWQ